MDRARATRLPVGSGIPAWYRAYLERRRTRILRLHVLVANLTAHAAKHAVVAPGPTEPATGTNPAAPRS